jgi:hypothetical protein
MSSTHVERLMAPPCFQNGRQIYLPRGATQTVWGQDGAIIVCAGGRVRRRVELPGLEQVPQRIVDVTMHPGEIYLFDRTGLLRLSADADAMLLCVSPASRMRAWWAGVKRRLAKYGMIPFIRRGVEQSGSSSGS